MTATFPLALALQGGVLAASVAAATLVPPAEGQALLVPLTPVAARRAAALAIGHGARLVARGPWPGSLVVEGRRAALWRTLLGAGILVTASPGAGCGTGGARDGQP